MSEAATLSIEDEVSLGQLLNRATQAYEHIQSAPSTNDSEIQSKIDYAISDLTICSSIISRLSILSSNETIEDLNTNDLRCLSVNGLRGMLIILKKTSGGGERKACLELAKTHLKEFATLIESYEVIDRQARQQYKGPISSNQNPSLRREGKIAQFKLEKQLKARLEEFQKRSIDRQQSAIKSSSSSITTNQKHEENEDEDEGARESYLTYLKYLYLKAHQELNSLDLELDLLGSGAQMNNLPSTSSTKEDDTDLSWRLDRLSTKPNGPLIDPSGKILRPFTILPSSKSSSSATDRIRLKAEVFRPDWNLPTMTIDEYLDEQQSMGNFLSGGGPKQAETETDGERAKREAEEDNQLGEVQVEVLRQKSIKWDQFTDTHRKGEGNMMNRG